MKKYDDFKKHYYEYVLLFKEGNFYRVYEKDAIIISRFTSYNIINKKSRGGGIFINRIYC